MSASNDVCKIENCHKFLLLSCLIKVTFLGALLLLVYQSQLHSAIGSARLLGGLVGGWGGVKIENNISPPPKKNEFVDARAFFLSLRVAWVKQYATNSLETLVD